MRVITSGARAYVADTGSMLLRPAYETPWPAADGTGALETDASNVWYSEDGAAFRELASHAWFGSGGRFTDALEDVEARHLLHLDGEQGDAPELVLNGTRFTRTGAPVRVEAVPLPEIRDPEMLFVHPDGRWIYLSGDHFRPGYDAYRLFIGRGDELQRVPLRVVSRDRGRDVDWTIRTAAGAELLVGARRDGGVATFEGVQLDTYPIDVALESTSFDESADRVVFAPPTPAPPRLWKVTDLFELPGGTLLLRDFALGTPFKETQRFFVGTPGTLAQATVVSDEYDKFSRITTVRTDRGTLTLPSTWDEPPRWSPGAADAVQTKRITGAPDGVPATRCRIAYYTLDASDRSVTLRPGPALAGTAAMGL